MDALAPDTRAMLDAYAAGVNARIAAVNEGAAGRGAPEFFLFPPEIAPWRAADSVALVKLMALQLTGQAAAETLRARASLVLPPERVEDLHGAVPGPGTVALASAADLFPGLPRRAVASAGRPPLWPVPEPDLAGASNAFAVAGDRAASGGALLANDPHLGLTAPSACSTWPGWSWRPGAVIGATIPGLPVVVAGRSARIGWGVTSSYVDDQDILIERLNPDDPSRYETPDGWAEFETDASIIEIDGQDPVTLRLRRTANGPVLTGSQFDLGPVTPPGHVAVLQWTALGEADTSLDAGLRLMRAQDVEQALEAAKRCTSRPRRT